MSRRTISKTAPVNNTVRKARSAARREFSWPAIWPYLLVFGAAVLAYFPVMNGSVIWDDNTFVFNNPVILSPNGLYKIWFTTQAIDYFPLTLTTFWFEWRLWHHFYAGYHISNILLHGCNAALFYLLLKKMKLPGAFWGGLIYAVHPVNVISVAWITERKNTLSMLFYLSSAILFVQYADCRQKKSYIASFACFLLALLSKSSTVVLAPILMLYLWWEQRRQGKAFTTKDLFAYLWITLPYFVAAMALGALTVWFQRHHNMGGANFRPESMPSRIAAAGWVVWFYLYKDFLPHSLLMIYPRWKVAADHAISWMPFLGVVLIFAALAWLRLRWAVFAFGYFIMALGPVLGLLSMSFHQYSLVSDHLQHLALLMPVALLGTGAAWLQRQRRYLFYVPVGIVLILGAYTLFLSHQFRNEIALWKYNIKKYPECWVAYNNLGIYYSSQSKGVQVVEYNINPVDMASIARKAGDSYTGDNLQEALRCYDLAVRYKDDDADNYVNRGLMYLQLNRIPEALRDYNHAIQLSPNHTFAHLNRAILYARQKDYPSAVKDLNAILRMNPNDVRALSQRGHIYGLAGNLDAAEADYTAALQRAPQDPELYNGRSSIYFKKQQFQSAYNDATRALQINPAMPAAHLSRAFYLYGLGRYEESANELRIADQLGIAAPASFRTALQNALSKKQQRKL